MSILEGIQKTGPRALIVFLKQYLLQVSHTSPDPKTSIFSIYSKLFAMAMRKMRKFIHTK
jgi:hypothetical protein